jgi:hypothetical protein
VREFLFDRHAWTEYFIPGLRISLGPAWVAVVAVAFVGMVAATFARTEAPVRMLGFVGILSVAAYVCIPQYFGARRHNPIFFQYTLRYAAPALIIGAVLLPIAFVRYRRTVLGLLLGAVFLTQLDPTSWPTGFGWATFGTRIAGGDAVAAVVVLFITVSLVGFGSLVWNRAPPGRVRSIGAAGAAAIAVFGGLAAVHQHYLDSRYNDPSDAYGRVVAWARDVHDSRITVVGPFMQAQYPLYGRDLSNHVQFAGVSTAHGGWRVPSSCREWVQFLERGRYEYAAIGPDAKFDQWTKTQPDAHEVSSAPLDKQGVLDVRVYRLDHPDAPRHC